MAGIPPVGGGGPPPPPPFALGPGRSHNVLHFDDPTHGLVATKLCNNASMPMDDRFNGHANDLAVFLTSV